MAKVLGAPLDILLVRKIGAPGHAEYGIGAHVDGASPQLVIDEAAARVVEADQAYIDRQVACQLDEIERRRAAYRTAPPISLGKRSPRWARGESCLGVPLALRDVLPESRVLCDEVVCLASPEPFCGSTLPRLHPDGRRRGLSTYWPRQGNGLGEISLDRAPALAP